MLFIVKGHRFYFYLLSEVYHLRIVTNRRVFVWISFCRFQKMTEKEKQEMNKSEGGASSAKKARLSTDDTQFKTKCTGYAKTLKTSACN